MKHRLVAVLAVGCLPCAVAVWAAPQRTILTRARAESTVHDREAPRARRAPRQSAAEKPTRTITIGVNGAPPSGGLSGQIVHGRVFVPLRETFAALGLAFVRSGNEIRARMPTATVTFAVGSAQAVVGGRAIPLDAAVATLHGTTYVPLSLLVRAFGVQATYDQRGANVDIVSSFFGRTSGAQGRRADGGTDVQGVISALDVNSAPPSITVVRGGTARTISVTSDARIWVEDVTIHNQVAGTLTDLAVGDALHAILSRDGRLISVFDYYRSTSGTVSAVSPTALVLADGRVITPGDATVITLDGVAARMSDVRTGDYVTVRSNPESGELRQIVASRNAAGSSAMPVSGSVSAAIASVALSAQRPLRAGQSFDVVMKGTPGGRASFDIGDLLSGLPMRETASGVYTARFTIPDRFNVTAVPIYANLAVRGVNAMRGKAPQTLSAATIAPTIDQVAPTPGQTINNPRPSIFATFMAPTAIAINAASIAMTVDGHDVTSSATRMGSFIVYSPAVDLSNGPVNVNVKVSDAAGNTATRTWTFVVRS